MYIISFYLCYRRFSDVPEAPLESSFLEGYQNMPLVSLEEALIPVSSIFGDDLAKYVFIAKANCRHSDHSLTIDESAAIRLYTMEWTESESSIYRILNATLRLEDRHKIRPWFSYLKLILTALHKLPSYEGTVWRRVSLNMNMIYVKGQTIIWWAFYSTTRQVEVLESQEFTGKHGEQTVFSIQCKHGKEIGKYSYFQDDDEIILMPGAYLKVLGQMKLNANTTIIHLQEIAPPVPLLPLPFDFS